jgi:hypothetical protein
MADLVLLSIEYFPTKLTIVMSNIQHSVITPEGLNIPAQGNALGYELHIKKSPVRA